LNTITKYSRAEGLKMCAQYENNPHRAVKLALSGVYSEYGTDAQQPWFEKTMFTLYGRSQISFLYNYSEFLTLCKSSTVENAIAGLERLHANSFSATTRFFCTYVLRRLQVHYTQVANENTDKIEKLGGEKKSNPRIDRLKEERTEALRMVPILDAKRKELEKSGKARH
jgi:hypothetical protein